MMEKNHLMTKENHLRVHVVQLTEKMMQVKKEDEKKRGKGSCVFFLMHSFYVMVAILMYNCFFYRFTFTFCLWGRLK